MRPTRRAVLATLGAAAVAGCGGRDGYWDDPPPFDDSGLGAVTERPVPERPEPIPATLADEHLAAVTDRVAALLAPVPEPLTAETLPNGVIRERIVERREEARQALGRLDDRQTTPETVATAVEARGRAADAAGVWAAVHVGRSGTDVTRSQSALSDTVDALLADLPGEAAGPREGAVVYGTIAGWYDEAERSDLFGDPPSIAEQPNPLRVGRATRRLERVAARVDAGRHLHERYVASLDRPRSVESALSAAAADLGPRVQGRFERFHDGDGGDPRDLPGVDGLLDRDVPAASPGAALLSGKAGAVSDWLRLAAVAWPGTDGVPALRVRNAHRALADLAALGEVRGRVEDGEDLFPPDAAAVREAREAAIDAVAALAGSSSLERWAAWRLVPAFADPDGVLTGEEPPLRVVAGAYGEYVWVGAVARAVPDATATVAAALDG